MLLQKLLSLPSASGILWPQFRVAFADDGTGDGSGDSGKGGGDAGAGDGADKGKTGDDDAGKTGEGDKGKKGGTGEQLFDLKIDGQTRSVSAEELIKMAEKSGGADAKFREAADLRKSNEKAVRAYELFKEIQQDSDDGKIDNDKITEFTGLMGFSAAEFLEGLTGGEGEEEDKGDGKAKGKKGIAEAKKLSLDDFDPETQEILKAARKSQLGEVLAGVKNQIKEAIDSDKVSVKIIEDTSGGDEKIVAARKDALTEMVFEDVQRRIQYGEQYGPELIRNCLQIQRTRANQFGIPSKSSKQTDMGLQGLGPTGMPFAAGIQANEPTERVPSTERGYEENFMARLARSMVRGKKPK